MSHTFRGWVDSDEHGRVTYTAQINAIEASGLEFAGGLQLAAFSQREQDEVTELLSCAVAECKRWHRDASADLRAMRKAGA